MQDRACRRDGARCGKIPHTIRDPMLFPGLLAHKKFPPPAFLQSIAKHGKNHKFFNGLVRIHIAWGRVAHGEQAYM